VPAPLLAGLLVALVTRIALQVGAAVGSLGSAAIVGDGPFRATPMTDGTATASFVTDD
jgi:hypothetical protein